MNDKTESSGYDEEEPGEAVEETEGLDVDHLLKGIDSLKRRAPKGSDPAWRRLERYREKKRTDELLSDFEDFDIGDEPSRTGPKNAAKKKP